MTSDYIWNLAKLLYQAYEASDPNARLFEHVSMHTQQKWIRVAEEAQKRVLLQDWGEK